MTFGQPDLLYFLIALPVAVGALYWSLKKRSSDILRIGNADLIARLYASVNRRGRKAKLGLWFVSLALVVVALSRPQWGSETEIIEQEGSQVMIALDISNSMLAEDIAPNRLEATRKVLTEFIGNRPNDRLGLAVFSG